MRCTRCSADLPAGARFCSACGAPLTLSSDDPAEPSGELRTLSVVFADMSGSVAAAHGLDPESSTERVNQVLEAMVSAVTGHGGTVDRFLGDGLLALFGTPHAHEDDPVRAVAAAVDLCERVGRLGADATAGVHTGAVYLGRIGSALHSETTAMGDVVNLAARLQGKAAPGTVLVSAATAPHVTGAFDLEERRVEVKGVPDPLLAYVVAGRRERPQRAPRPEAARAPTTGRDAELARLRAAVADLESGRGGVALVVGEPGLGKTRLVSETIAASAQSRVLEGRCLESGTSSYWPFADALRAHFGWAADAGDAARIAAIERECDRVDAAERDTVVAAVATLLGIPDATPRGERWASMPAALRQRETYTAVRTLLGALAGEQPLLLVVEDLHWADSLSVGLVASLLEDTTERALLLLGTYRPERDHECWRLGPLAAERCGERSVALTLGELDAGDAELVARSLLDSDDLSPEVREVVVSRAQGNPLYMEEVVRSAVDSGTLVRDDTGRWSVSDRAAAASVPDTLERLVRSRVDRLPRDHQRVLQLAAVIGRLFSPGLVARLAGDGHDVGSVLDDLDRHDLVYRERLVPDEEWTFKHALVRETIYQSILRRDRAALHGRVVAAIEEAEPSRAAERPAELAHHAALAGDHERAHRYLRLAAQQAASAYLNDAAIDFYRRAIEHGEAAGAGAASTVELHEGLGDVLRLLGRHDEATAALKSALALGPAPLTAARLHRKLARVHVTVREYEAAISDLDAGDTALGGRPSPDDRARWEEWLELRFDRGRLEYWRNRPGEIAAIVDEVEADVEARCTAHTRVDMKTLRMMQLLRQSRYRIDERLTTIADECVELAGDDPDLGFRGFTRFNAGFVHLWDRDLDLAERDLDVARVTAERAGDVVTLSRCHTYLAVCHRFRSDIDACRASVAAALAVSGAGAMVEYVAAGRANLAWIALREGRHADVVELAAEAFDLWQHIPLTYGFQWTARFPRMAVALADGDLDEAQRQAAAMRTAEQQVLPEPLDGLLVAATAGDLARAVELGRPLGYA